MHDPQKSRRHLCHECDAGFRYPKDLKRHTNSKHSDITYACADCPKLYRRNDYLIRHTHDTGHRRKDYLIRHTRDTGHTAVLQKV